MKVIKYEERADWLIGRRGKITGTKLQGLTPTLKGEKREAYWDFLAEMLAIAPDEESPMARGQRLEPKAIDKFEEITGKKMCRDLVIWTRDDNDRIACSPDAFDEVTLEEAVESKCLGSGKHIKAIVTKTAPEEYKLQALQYFIVNEGLKILHFAMFDDRFIEKLQYICFTFKREELESEIEKYLELERKSLEDIDELVKSIMVEV